MPSISINDLKNGDAVVIGGDPCEVLFVKHLHMGRGGSSIQTRIRNLRTGQVLERNFKPADSFEEAEIEKKEIVFIYGHRGEFWFQEPDNPGNRFSLSGEQIGEAAKFMKPQTKLTTWLFDDKVMKIVLPIKVDLKVIEAPPSIRGNTAQGGAKVVVLETGAKISAPLFINEGDVVRVNTQTGEYVERVVKR